MAYSSVDRKVAMLRLGLTQTQVAIDLGIAQPTVNRVVVGAQYTGRQSEIIMTYLSGKLGVPRAELFPESVSTKE